MRKLFRSNRGARDANTPPPAHCAPRRKLLAAAAGVSLMSALDPALRAGAWAAGSDAPEKTEVKIGFIPLTDCASVVIASVMKFDEKYGIKIVPSKEASWAAVRDKLVNGELDAAHVLYGLVYGVQMGIGGPKKDMAVLMSLNQFKEAHAEIEAARGAKPAYAEASAVEGRIYREEAFTDDAIRSFRRAIREGGGVQPEALVGLAKVLEDKGQFAEAIVEYRKALAQLSDSEPVIYQMLGAAYERVEKPKDAVVAYEKYLELAPNGSYAAAIRSILTQLKREAAGEQIIP